MAFREKFQVTFLQLFDRVFFFLANAGNGKLEKLTGEKKALEEEVTALKEKLELQMRHEGGIGAAMLHEKLEAQERKLAVLELASQVCRLL